MRRCWLSVGLGFALAATAIPAMAQTERPRLRPPPPPAARPAGNTLDNVMTGDGAQPTGAPRGRIIAPPAPAPPVLRSAVHSRYSRPAVIGRSTTGQCRVQCYEARNTCASGGGDTSGCDPGWTQCLSACAGLSYSRGP